MSRPEGAAASSASFEARIREMVRAVERGDGAGVRACFSADGVYHDVFYGAFRGDEITRLINDYFWRDARDFRWDIHDPVEADGVGYARYVFSYQPTFEGAEGGRAMFEGVAICRMQDGLIHDYREIAREGAALVQMGFAPARIAKYLAKQNQELRGRDEADRHVTDA